MEWFCLYCVRLELLICITLLVKDIMESFMGDMQRSLVGQLAAQMAIMYGLEYDFNQNSEGAVADIQNVDSLCV